MKKAILQLFGFSFLLLLAHFILQMNFSNYIFQFNWAFILLLGVVTMLTIYLFKINPEQPFKNFMTGTMIRMILSVLGILVILLFMDVSKIVLVVNFMVIYLLFLGFDIYSLLTNFRTQFK